MLRGNFKRGSFNASRYRNRNPDNLHVIPISSAVNNNPMQLQPDLVMQKIFPSVVPVPILPVTTSVFSGANNYQSNFNKRRKRARKRDRKNFSTKTVVADPSDYHWFNPNNAVKSNVTDIPVEKKTEKTEVVPEAPPLAEEHFEEVEVASTEGDGKRIPVGFRKTKLRYLNYKKKSFFKPKFYDFSSQRTVVNCLNVEDDDSVDVDVVSEAEYDGYETDPYDAVEKFGKIIEIEDEDETDEGEEETVRDDNEMEEESAHIVTDETEESIQAVSEEMDEEHITADDNEIGNKSTVADEINEKSTCTDEINEKSTCTDEIKKVSIDDLRELKKENLVDKKEVLTSKTWINKACFEGNEDLIQAKSLIQEKLDAWESHLIGLEYLLEICDKKKVSVSKYYCVLCDEEFDVQELPESYVINHVSGRNHITKYLEKHFPTCGFKLSENSSYDFVIFQKLCEKINENLGYYFLCITNNDYYSENKLKIKETIENASHPSEVEFKFEKCTFEKDTDSDLSKNINNVIENVIKKLPENEIVTAEPNKKSEESKSKSNDKLSDMDIKKKPAAPKPKHKGNNSVSAFLRLKFAATNKLKSSDKEKNKKTKSNTTETGENVKSQNEEAKENLKSQNEQQIKESSNKPVIKNTKSKNDQRIKSPVPEVTIQKVQRKEDRIIETITLDDDTPEDDIEFKNEQIKKKESKEETQNLENLTTDKSTPVKAQEATSDVVKNVAAKKVFKNKEKVLLKTTIHSKHCRKINQVVFASRQIKVC